METCSMEAESDATRRATDHACVLLFSCSLSHTRTYVPATEPPPCTPPFHPPLLPSPHTAQRQSKEWRQHVEFAHRPSGFNLGRTFSPSTHTHTGTLPCPPPTHTHQPSRPPNRATPLSPLPLAHRAQTMPKSEYMTHDQRRFAAMSPQGMVSVFRQKFTLQDAIAFHAFASLEALPGV
jgi:hypothetical protein